MNLPGPQPTSSTINLRRLSALRNIAILGQTVVVLGAHFGLHVPLPLGALGLVILAEALVNLFTWLRLGWRRPVSEPELFAQLLADVAALSGLLYFTGGSTNPFVLLYLVPLTLTAAALPWLYAWTMVAMTSGCYTLLLFVHVPLPQLHMGHATDFDLHVLGMWVGFALSAALIGYFAVKMAETLRSRDRMLAELREKELRNERIVALGTLAAGAAHELSTPLSTMAVVIKELEHAAARDDRNMASLRLLREQIDRCKGILSTLSASAGELRAEAGRRLALDRYLEEVLAQWRAMRPTAFVETRWDGPRPGPQIVTESTLSQAIVSLLNNAADASPDSVEVNGRWCIDRLELEICDRGPGLEPAVRERAGTPFFTTKRPGEGLGLGLFLAHATVQRLGGTVQLANRESGGACARVVLPLANLLVTR